MSRPLRCIVTGARDYVDVGYVRDVLSTLPHGSIIVHGGCTGCDAIAEVIAHTIGCITEVHPADWSTFGKFAGPKRNQEMVDLGADIVHAFPGVKSNGTWDTVNKAKAAGLPTMVHNPRLPGQQVFY